MKPFRIPLAGAYNTRVSAVNAADSTSGYVGVGIVGLMIVGQTSQSTDKDARYVNCFQQTVNTAFGKKVYLVKRPGWGTLNTPAAGAKGIDILIWTGQGSGTKVITAFGDPTSTIYDGTTSLGAITGKTTGITETFVGSTATLTVTSDDHTAWYYDTGVGVMTKITDVDFPGNAGKSLAGKFAHMDGFACILDTTGALWASDLNSVSAWTSTSFDSANAYPDKGVAAVRFKNFVIAFGTESMQFFYNAGLTPFPFAKAIAMTVKVGAVSASAITQISDTIFWCGSTPQGGLSIFQYDGNLNRISPSEIDAVMLLAGASNITLTSIRFYGKSFVLVNVGINTFAYCIEEKMWLEWSSTTPLWKKCAGQSLGGTMLNYAVSDVSTSGKVYQMNHSSLIFTDDGATYTARIQLPKLDMGTNRKKFFASAEIIGDVETSTSEITLSCSDDDYQNYTTLKTLDLSEQRRLATRLGSARRRAWVLTHAANTPMRIEALEITATVGSS